MGRRAVEMEVQGRRNRVKRSQFDKVRDDNKKKGLSGEEVYDRATCRCTPSNIDP